MSEIYTFRVDGVVFTGEEVPRKYQKAGLITVRVDTWPWPNEKPPKGNTVTLSKRYIIAESRKDS